VQLTTETRLRRVESTEGRHSTRNIYSNKNVSCAPNCMAYPKGRSYRWCVFDIVYSDRYGWTNVCQNIIIIYYLCMGCHESPSSSQVRISKIPFPFIVS